MYCREHLILKTQTDLDKLGAEALPGGFSEILRILRPEIKPAVMIPKVRKGRGILGFFAKRRKPQIGTP